MNAMINAFFFIIEIYLMRFFCFLFTGPIVGHVGDGNFHSWLLMDLNKPEEVKEAKALSLRMAQ